MVVFDMLKLRAPSALILLVLLINWNQQLPHDVDRDFCEVFAGRAECSAALRAVGLRGTSIDWELDRRVFDLTQPPAFLLTLNEIMRCKPGSLLILAPDCRSMSRMSRYTSGRTALAPYGHRGYRFVEIGNLLSSRTALMILVATWRGLRWLLEQPSGSFLKDLPRFQWLWDLLQVYTTTIFMGVFGSGSPKPHQLHSNDPGLLEALSHEAGYMSKEDRDQCPVKTTRRYVDSNGKRRCVGIPSALKESAHYPARFGEFIAEQAVQRRDVPLPDLPLRRLPASNDADLTDLQLFWKYCIPMGDLWSDADLWGALQYMARCKYLRVPHGWEEVLKKVNLR